MLKASDCRSGSSCRWSINEGTGCRVLVIRSLDPAPHEMWSLGFSAREPVGRFHSRREPVTKFGAPRTVHTKFGGGRTAPVRPGPDLVKNARPPPNFDANPDRVPRRLGSFVVFSQDGRGQRGATFPMTRASWPPSSIKPSASSGAVMRQNPIPMFNTPRISPGRMSPHSASC